MSANLPLEVTRENKKLSFRVVTAYILGQVQYSTPCCPTKGSFSIFVVMQSFLLDIASVMTFLCVLLWSALYP